MTSRKKNIKVLCVFSYLLGNKTLSKRYEDVLNHMPGVEPFYVTVDHEDFRKYKAPRLVRLSNARETAWVCERKVKDAVKRDDFDMMLVNGAELSLALGSYIRRYPTALAMDATAEQAHEMYRGLYPSPLKQIRSHLSAYFLHRRYQGIFKHIRIFLPMSHWCGEGLQKYYKVAAENITPTYVPMDLDVWRPVEKHHGEKMNLLFVGNDFIRKGGDILLEAYDKHLPKDRFHFVIVSGDPALKTMTLPDGVEWRSNIPHGRIVEEFHAADIFVFPTKKEYLGVVASEAAATGLPVISTGLGGLGEIVRDGYNGYNLPVGSSSQKWAEKILFLADHPEVRKEFGENGRRLAEGALDFKKFRFTVNRMIERLEKAHG